MSGSGTSAGIEFQQRVAALLLTYQYGELDICGLLNLHRQGHIVEMRFETDSPIDDITVHCREDWYIDLQIKRALVLSERAESDFVKVISQFVKAHLKNSKSTGCFGLITTSDSSSKIRYDLRKIFESVRLNDAGFAKNPLNQSESETLALFRRVFQQVFLKVAVREPTDDDFVAFSKRAFISVMDVEAGMPLESAALIVLKERGFSQPELVWSLLIKNSLHYASERMSISNDGLRSLLDAYKIDKDKTSGLEVIPTAHFELLGSKKVACGKEVLLVKSFVSECDYMVVELFRFDEASRKKVRFKNGKLLLGRDGIECEVVFRCSSVTGLERLMKEDEETFRDARIAILGANNIEAVEDTDYTRLYRAYFDDLVRANRRPQACLHCGKDVIDEKAVFVEIDEPGLPPTAGVVHAICRRPLDRVVGQTKSEHPAAKKLPQGFDLSGWVGALVHGQGLMNSIQTVMPKGRPIVVGWSSNADYDPDYSFSVRFVLEDGSEKYSYERGKVVRLSRAQAEAQVKVFAQQIQRQKELNNPCCFTSKYLTYGTYSDLLPIKADDERILEIRSVEVAPYTALLSKLYNTCEDYYAPMGIVREADSESPIYLFGNVVALISDPLRFGEFEDNWRQAGFECSALNLRVIKNDRDFDNLMRSVFADGRHPVIDPMFDKNGNLILGVQIQHLEAMIASRTKG